MNESLTRTSAGGGYSQVDSLPEPLPQRLVVSTEPGQDHPETAGHLHQGGYQRQYSLYFEQDQLWFHKGTSSWEGIDSRDARSQG